LTATTFSPTTTTAATAIPTNICFEKKKNKYVPRETARLTNTLARGHTSPNNKTADLLSAVAE